MQVGRRRLVSQRLAGPQFDEPVDVVRWMGAMQAQDYGQSLWAIASRLRKPSLRAVEEAAAAGAIVRTWPMRGTIHWVPAEDAEWMVALSSERTLAAHTTRLRQLELDLPTVDTAGRVLSAELDGGRSLTRPAVMRLWQQAGITTDGQRGYTLLWYLAHRGEIVIGPMEGRQQTFLRLDDFAPAARRNSYSDPGVELARRYLQGHGPATVQDFAWWCGSTLTESRRRVAELPTEAIGDREFLAAGGPVPKIAGMQLLAGFDEFVLGYQQRGDVLPTEFAGRIVPGNNGIFLPCVVADGQVVGTWKRKVGKAAVDISVVLFRPGSVPEAGLIAAARRYAEFLGVPLGAMDL